MTFSVLARDPATNTVGLCQGTGSINVASRCPQLEGGVIVSSQWHSDWRLGLRALDLGISGLAPDAIIEALRSTDDHFEYRQLGIVTDDGRAAAHTGTFEGGRGYAGDLVGDGFLVMGNGLLGPQVLEAMYSAFESATEVSFEERLLQSLEAGLGAGGEGRTHVSGSLMTGQRGLRRPLIDIRVDIAPEGVDSIAELRRIFDEYGPLMTYYSDYWLDHPEVTGEEWLAAGSPRSATEQLVS